MGVILTFPIKNSGRANFVFYFSAANYEIGLSVLVFDVPRAACSRDTTCGISDFKIFCRNYIDTTCGILRIPRDILPAP